MRARLLLLPLVAVIAVACSGADDPERVSSTLDCRAPGSGVAVPCTLILEETGGFVITLVSRECIATETQVSLTAPASVAGVVIPDACTALPGSEYEYGATTPFTAGTEIDMEITSDQFASPPGIRVTGDYPQWTINFEDGFDQDFNDIILRVTAVPAT